jgi:hypothetical protein
MRTHTYTHTQTQTNIPYTKTQTNIHKDTNKQTHRNNQKLKIHNLCSRRQSQIFIFFEQQRK